MQGKTIRFIIIAAVVLLALVLVFSSTIGDLVSRRHQASVSATTAPATLPRKAAILPRPLKIGVMCAASGQNWMGRNPKPKHEYVVKELRDPSATLVALIEPNTADVPEIAEALAGVFKAGGSLDATDAKALAALDVIVSGHTTSVLPDVLAAVESAVSGGVGFVRWGNFGDVQPGFADPAVVRLTGLNDAFFAITPDPPGVELEVVAEHPILGNVKPGRRLKIQASGAYGTMTTPPATPLVKLVDPSQLKFGWGPAPDKRADNYYMIYTSQLGKGRIVGCPFPAFREIPPSMNRAVGGKFILRCCAWAAEGRAAAGSSPISR